MSGPGRTLLLWLRFDQQAHFDSFPRESNCSSALLRGFVSLYCEYPHDSLAIDPLSSYLAQTTSAILGLKALKTLAGKPALMACSAEPTMNNAGHKCAGETMLKVTTDVCLSIIFLSYKFECPCYLWLLSDVCFPPVNLSMHIHYVYIVFYV